jgi:hypothetical protein
VKTGRFLYVTPGCPDPAYAMGFNANALAHVALVGTDTAWIPDKSVAPVTINVSPGMSITLYSRLIDASGAVGACTPVVSGTITLWTLKPVDVSTFVPPFRIR